MLSVNYNQYLAPLVLLIGQVLVSSSSASCLFWSKPTRATFAVQHKNVITPEQLMDELGQYRKLRGVFVMNRQELIDRAAVEAAEYLAGTKNKNKPRTILNRYSVNDLLALNDIQAKDLDKPGELERRERMCKSFEPDLRWYQVFKTAISDENKLHNQKVFLYHYCQRTLKSFKELMRDHLHERASDSLASNDLDVFRRMESEFDEFQRMMRRPDSDALFREFIWGLSESQLIEIREACRKLTGFMQYKPMKLDSARPIGHRARQCNSILSWID